MHSSLFDAKVMGGPNSQIGGLRQESQALNTFVTELVPPQIGGPSRSIVDDEYFRDLTRHRLNCCAKRIQIWVMGNQYRCYIAAEFVL